MFSIVLILAVTLAAFVTPSAWGQGPQGQAGKDWRLGLKIVDSRKASVEIVEVFENSPAKDIGLQPKDEVIAIDGNLQSNPDKMREYVMGMKGDTITIVYKRGVACEEVNAKLITMAKEVQNSVIEILPDGRRVVKTQLVTIQMQGALVQSRKKVQDPRAK